MGGEIGGDMGGERRCTGTKGWALTDKFDGGVSEGIGAPEEEEEVAEGEVAEGEVAAG